MSLVDDNASVDTEVKQEVTLESIATRLDALGAQMDWLCTNLASLFGFVQSMSQNGGGLRGMMKALKQEVPEFSEPEGEKSNA